MHSYGPQTDAGNRIHAEKHRLPGESFRESANRIAAALQDDDNHYHALREVLIGQRFLPAGRIQAGAGTGRRVTMINCFVSGVIQDSYVDGVGGEDFFLRGSIMARAAEAAATMKMGGGIGYDFSTLRPRGDMIRSQGTQSSGPVSFMTIFDALGHVTASAGHRRGAQMGVLACWHPDIEEFIHAKQNETALRGFNISIGVTDDFMEAVRDGREYDLRFEGRVYKTVHAPALWEQIMRSTWDWAEPGVLFIDRINQKNNLKYCETIATSNPCGEQVLPPYGACLLGSFNLVKYLRPNTGPRSLRSAAFVFDWEQLRRDIPIIHAMMDNVVEQSRYPLTKQREEALSKRRMGLGITATANAGEALGFEYGSPEFCGFVEEVCRFITLHAYRASALRAREYGSFPLFDRDQYMASEFVQQLDPMTRDMLAMYGSRNSHLTSIAPTGTISLGADNISSGIEPVFAYRIDRTIQTFNGPRNEIIEDYGHKFLNVRGKLAQDCTADDHLNVLIAASRWIDSAVSKTCTVSGKMPWADFKDMYFRAWEGGCKGITTFNPSGKRFGMMVAADDEPEVEPVAEERADMCTIVNGVRECG